MKTILYMEVTANGFIAGSSGDTSWVSGGSSINSLFMESGLIDEIYIDVEPIVLGSGIKLFAEEDFEYDLEFLKVNKINPHTIQLHYKVIKDL